MSGLVKDKTSANTLNKATLIRTNLKVFHNARSRDGFLVCASLWKDDYIIKESKNNETLKKFEILITFKSCQVKVTWNLHTFFHSKQQETIFSSRGKDVGQWNHTPPGGAIQGACIINTLSCAVPSLPSHRCLILLSSIWAPISSSVN